MVKLDIKDRKNKALGLITSYFNYNYKCFMHTLPRLSVKFSNMNRKKHLINHVNIILYLIHIYVFSIFILVLLI